MHLEYLLYPTLGTIYYVYVHGVIMITDTLRARTCMSITKPCDLALPKFAASLMQSPRSPSMKRHSMESPLSSPALPSPAIKPFSDFSTERIPIIKTGACI